MKARAASLVLGFLMMSSAANAALTSSEKGQLKGFVAGAHLENAAKVRSLVARTDLSPDESVAALGEAVAAVPFTEQRGAFLKELVFGPASNVSRPTLTQATVKALLARADAVIQRYVGGLDHEPQAVAELSAIYAWLDAAIANAGKPTFKEHDGSAGIPAATYEECGKAVREHIEHNARWLKGDGAVPETASRLRAQAQVMFIDMLPDGLTRRADAADRLGLRGARKALLSETGVLFADAGKTDDAKVERVRQLFAHLPGASEGLGVIYAGTDRTRPLQARGVVVVVASTGDKYPFAEAAPATYDPAASAIAHDLAVLVAKRALDARSELREQAERDAAAATGDPSRLLGRPRAPSVEHVVGAAVHALVIDAPRTIDLALARLKSGNPESAALLSDALGVLVALAPGDAKSIDLAKGGAWAPATQLKLAPNGVALGFTFDGHPSTIDRAAPSYAVTGARRDGAAVSVAK